MKTIISNRCPVYTVAYSHRITESTRYAVNQFTATVKERTGAELIAASYDENGTLRGLWSAAGLKLASFSREGGVIANLYGAGGKRLARYNAEGTLIEIYNLDDARGKVLANVRANGTVEALFDMKGKPLADCDAVGALVAIRHPASDILTEADEEYAERLALARERLEIVDQMIALEKETLAAITALRETVLANRAAGREIAIASMGNRPLTKEIYAELPLTGYDVRFDGETLTVRAYADLLLQKAFGALLETIGEGDAWELAENYNASAVDSRISTVLPEFKTAEGVLRGVCYCGDENFEICIGGATEAEYRAYVADLTAAGFVTYAENQIADCLFGTYTIADDKAGGAVVFTMHYPNLNRTQIVYGPRGYLPSTEPAAMPDAPMQTTLTQPGRLCVYYGNAGASVNGAPGMSYVAQLADGSYIVIDGGPGDGKVIPKIKKKGVWLDQPEVETHDEENLYEFLCEHAPNGEKPRIAAWFITHPHGDHMGLANRFLQDYAGKVDIELTAFNFPDFDTVFCKNERPIWHKGSAVPFREKMDTLYGAKQLVMHAGQKIFFPGCEVEVLYTQEDYYPCDFHWGNHLSCAFRMKFADKTVMILGDCEKTNCQDIADAYGAELKSDILQLTHHGFNGACFDINKLVDPEICLWACDGFRFECDVRNLGTADGYLFNRYLRDRSIKKREHYYSDTTVTLEV